MRPLYEKMLGGLLICNNELTYANEEINIFKGLIVTQEILLYLLLHFPNHDIRIIVDILKIFSTKLRISIGSTVLKALSKESLH